MAVAKEWLIAPASPDCEGLAHRWHVPPIVAQLLINRGHDTHANGSLFLRPPMKELHPPDLLPGALEAARIIVRAIRDGTKILLYGDYDVDGTTGVAALWHILHRAGAEVSFYVPHRIEEGYGLNLEAAKRLLAEGAGLIITVDCGITAVEEARAIREAGARLIITDHHTLPDELPGADAIVHPAIGNTYPSPHLCGAGVAFKLGWAVAKEMSGTDRVAPEFRDLLLQLLPLAALGTIADLVPLVGENRVIALHGLTALARTTMPGLRALIESAGLTSEKVSGYDVGFKLAPRINAAGRMGHARLAVELLTRADEPRAKEIALYLEDHNRARQAKERQIAKQANEIIERNELAGDTRRAIVLASHGWHPGVIGIVAARVVERFHRPAVLIALSGSEGQGSARSIRHFHLHDALTECRKHLIAHGGHAMAAGLRIAADNVQPFTEAFVEIANQRLTAADLVPRLRLDAEVALADLDLSLAETIAAMGPFGLGNPRPKLATGWVTLADEPRCVGRQQTHLQASFRENGTCLKGIGFGLAGAIEDLKQHRRCRVAFEPIINEYNARRSVELQILDMQFPTA
jgi:single-stranded-DNA-specific exonuclease